ncbi:MAG: polymer-forming cytoskeletal protein [Candidatus Manganitrophaceae bacterium]
MASVFGREENNKRPSEEMVTFMGKNVAIKGNLDFEGSGRIDGKVEGKISVKGSVIFGEAAVITSEVEGDTVVIGGKVTGTVTARQKIQLLRTSIVTGELITPSLLIEDGAQFNGSCKMGKSAPAADEKPEFRKVEEPRKLALASGG